MVDLDAASVEDVRDFHSQFYVPHNATVAIVGDFDVAQAKELVTRYLGRVPKSDRVIPREYPREPASKAERRVTVNENWPLPAVVVAYPITYDGHPDSYPLHLTSKILSDGDSSRIYQSLVYEKQIALSAFGGGNIIEEPNLFFAVALVAPGRTHEEVEKALIAEFDKLRNEPISERELQRAKNQFFRDYIVDRESVRGKASQLAHAVVIHDDITTADGEVEIFTNMKVSDLQRVAKTYFTPENRLVLTILPKGSR
jgi:zinc protease